MSFALCSVWCASCPVPAWMTGSYVTGSLCSLHRLLNESCLELLAFQVRMWSTAEPHWDVSVAHTHTHTNLHVQIPFTHTQRALKEFVLTVDDAFGKQFEEFNIGFEGR